MVLVSRAIFRNPPLQQVLRGYGWPLFAGREMFGRHAMDIGLDLAVSGEKLLGRGIFELETRPQSLAGNQADHKTLCTHWIDMASCKFDALRRWIENRDRIERQNQSQSLADVDAPQYHGTSEHSRSTGLKVKDFLRAMCGTVVQTYGPDPQRDTDRRLINGYFFGLDRLQNFGEKSGSFLGGSEFI
jgi:hypothetical protein